MMYYEPKDVVEVSERLNKVLENFAKSTYKAFSDAGLFIAIDDFYQNITNPPPQYPNGTIIIDLYDVKQLFIDAWYDVIYGVKQIFGV